jgi:hypothetical protein
MRVTLNYSEIQAFKRGYPCNGIPELDSITFEYDSNGLCDIDARLDGKYVDSATFDGEALLALSQDAEPKRRLSTMLRTPFCSV